MDDYLFMLIKMSSTGHVSNNSNLKLIRERLKQILTKFKIRQCFSELININVDLVKINKDQHYP